MHDRRIVARRARSALLLVLLTSTACYTFRPATVVQPGTDVRARLNVEAAVRRSQSQDEPMRHVDGRVLAYSPQALSLDVLVAHSASVFQGVELRDTVTLERSEIEAIFERRLSTGRTLLMTAAVVGGAVAVAAGISSVVGGTEEPDDPGNPNIVVPVFSIGSLRSFRLLGLPIRR